MKLTLAVICICLVSKSLASWSPSRSLAEVELNTERECELEVDMEEEIEFECKSEVTSTTDGIKTGIEDKIKFKVSLDKDGLKVKIKYEQETETEDEQSETEMQVESETSYEIVFDRIVEYTTMQKNGAYDWDESKVVGELLLTEFGSFSQVANYTESTYAFSVTSRDGMATFFFTISEGRDDEALNANKMKIDFELKNYGWVGAIDETHYTYVALLAKVETEKEVDTDYRDSAGRLPEDIKIRFDDALADTGVRPFGEFTWATEALALREDMPVDETSVAAMSMENTATIDVIATAPGDSTDRIAFSFVGDAASGSADLYWDPEAGIGYSTTSGIARTLITLAIALPGLSLLLLW